ncbi:MAG: hypothetical protein WCO71_06810 [Pseudomonadota bacterium]
MKFLKAKFLIGSILLAALNSSSCSALGGLMGGGGGASPALPDASGIINGLIPTPSLTGNSESNIPFQILTSNQRLDAPDGAKLYGQY